MNLRLCLWQQRTVQGLVSGELQGPWPIAMEKSLILKDTRSPKGQWLQDIQNARSSQNGYDISSHQNYMKKSTITICEHKLNKFIFWLTEKFVAMLNPNLFFQVATNMHIGRLYYFFLFALFSRRYCNPLVRNESSRVALLLLC